MKWIEISDAKATEGYYLDSLEERLGYKLQFNMKAGNKKPTSDNETMDNLTQDFGTLRLT